jgi:hypothetical protein
VKWDTVRGYGEVKSAAQGQDHYVVCRDLYKVAVFCKNSMDNRNMDGMLGIHLVGRTTRFYVLKLPATSLYVLLELAPCSLNNLPSFFTEIVSIIKVLQDFEQVCVRSNNEGTIIKRRTH